MDQSTKLSHSAQHIGSVSGCNSQDIDGKQKFLVCIYINCKGWLLVGSAREGGFFQVGSTIDRSHAHTGLDWE